ncbi:hypothetical protein AAFF_G00415590 [Aldrovandia affinis]|uniref:Uncharacterized protein n=1 Tax=Aldrovandia affinis TaxID=143900 RepID=A0AAD7WJP6_9TELE|nr:hypothetical protein AAFF_G00415590 [Aldrovandia affinis]
MGVARRAVRAAVRGGFPGQLRTDPAAERAAAAPGLSLPPVACPAALPVPLLIIGLTGLQRIRQGFHRASLARPLYAPVQLTPR